MTTSESSSDDYLLTWEDDEDSDEDGAIAAWFENPTYHVWPVRDDDGEIVGYAMDGGDVDSGYEPIGSVDIDCEPGEPTLQVMVTLPPHTTAVLILTHSDAVVPIGNAVQHAGGSRRTGRPRESRRSGRRGNGWDAAAGRAIGPGRSACDPDR
jgi:hypothetical protein